MPKTTFAAHACLPAVRNVVVGQNAITGSVLALVFVCSPALVSANWYRYVVDNTAANTGTSIAVAGGVPRLAYYADVGLKYAFWDYDHWEVETLDFGRFPHNSGPSLLFDKSGRPHIAYYRGTPWYVRWNGSEWVREQIDADSAGDYISLALDSLGRPHVAYSKRRSLFYNMLKYAWRDGAGWHPELVDSLGGTDCVLRFDLQGRSCVAHCASWSSGGLYYSTRTETGWVKDTLLVGNASQCCMAMDGAGKPHLSYFWAADGNFDLRYAVSERDTWRFDIVDPGRQLNKRGWDNCITRDRAGNYHISYHAHNELQLRYARGRFGNWSVEVVDTVGGWNLCSSIALDEQGRAYIAYCDESEGDALYLASQADLTGVGETPDVEGRMPNLGATIVRGVLLLPSSPLTTRYSLFTPAGRKVMELHPGENDVRHLSPGVYFLREHQAQAQAQVVSKVLVTK